MTPLFWAGLGVFLVVMGSVTAAGYFLFYRPQTASADGFPDLDSRSSGLVDVFEQVGTVFPAARSDSNPLRKKLAAAGYRLPQSASVFYGIKVGAALVLATIFSAASLLFGEGALLLPFLCGAGLGFLLPDRLLQTRARGRMKDIRSGLPAALDLLILSLEAGQALDAALLETSRGLAISHPVLSQELRTVYLELRASKSRAEALHHLAERNNEPELRKVVALLIDSDRFGSALGPSLRTHVKYLRMRYRQSAQESARKVGVKLVFPVFFLIFPSVILVTLGPALILLYNQFSRFSGL